MFGPIGREVLGWGYWLFQIFIASAGMLGFSIALNAITVHVRESDPITLFSLG
jgi:hypothetical protein